MKEGRLKRLWTVWFYLYDILEKVKTKDKKLDQWAKVPTQRIDYEGPQKFFRDDGNTLYLDCDG